MMCEPPRLAIPCQDGATLALDMYAPIGMIRMAEKRTALAGLRPPEVAPDESGGLRRGETLSQEGAIADAPHIPNPHGILPCALSGAMQTSIRQTRRGGISALTFSRLARVR